MAHEMDAAAGEAQPVDAPGRADAVSAGVVLLTGASGYVGGRLRRALEEAGVPLRCLARSADSLRARVGAGTEVAQGDVLDPDSLSRAMAGVGCAYYLVHSMSAPRGFEDLDLRGALNFARAAEAAGVRRIVYLGGLCHGPGETPGLRGAAQSPERALSPHMRSRMAVGDALRSTGVATIELRASIILGSGSLSFEMIRALVERLPVMVTPRWVSALAQPIGIADAVAYLMASRTLAVEGSRVYEIGGPDRISYGGLMREYGRQRGLRRWFIPVPALTPGLSSRWLCLVTPLYARVGARLIDSVRHPSVVQDESALEAFGIRPVGVRESIAAALRNEDADFAETRWSDALSAAGPGASWGGARFGSRLVDSRSMRVSASPAEAFRPIRRIGGETGWYYGDLLWRIRGRLDQLVGGVGVRRGRRDPETPGVGDALDFWRVEAFAPDRLLRLRAEMKTPGRAWLEFEVTPDGEGAVVRQTALFDPVGLFGLAYWYALFPLHQLVFAGMLRGIAREAIMAARR